MIRFYADENVDGKIIRGLQSRGLDVLTALEDGYDNKDDNLILNRAGELKRLLFSQDTDLLRIAHERHEKGLSFAGVVFAEQKPGMIGRFIEDLALIAEYTEPAEYRNRVQWLPLR